MYTLYFPSVSEAQPFLGSRASVCIVVVSEDKCLNECILLSFSQILLHEHGNLNMVLNKLKIWGGG